MIDDVAAIVTVSLWLVVFVRIIARPSLRAIVLAILVVSFTEDLARKVLGAPIAITLCKDALLVLAFLVAGRSKSLSRTSEAAKPVLAWCALSVILLGLAQWLTGSMSLLTLFVGLRSYIFYLAAAYVGLVLGGDVSWARRFVRGAVVAIAAVSVLGFLDRVRLLPASTALSPFTEQVGIRTFGPGDPLDLGSSIFGLGERLARYALFGLVLGVTAWVPTSRGERFMRLMTVGACLLGIVIAGRRSAWVLLALATVLIATAQVTLPARQEGRRFRAPKWALGVPICLIYVIYVVGGPQLLAFGASAAGSINERRGGVLDLSKGANATGGGIGRASQGAGDFAIGSAKGAPVEAGLAKVKYEMGYVGLFVFSLLHLGILGLLCRSRGERELVVAALTLYVCLLFWFAKGAQILGDSQTLLQIYLLVGLALGRERMAQNFAPRHVAPPAKEAAH